MSNLKKFLTEHKIDVIKPPKNGVIEIDSKSSLISGFELLMSNNIQSAPVYDSTKKEYVGFLDVRDLVSFISFVYDEQKVEDTNTLRDIIIHGLKQFGTPTTDGVTVSYLARRNRFTPVKEGSSLLDTCKLLAEFVHRVPVINDEGRVVNIISQYSIIAYLYENIGKIKKDLQDTIGNIKIGSTPVLSVNKKQLVIETLRLMDKTNRSGVAIIDDEKRLVGTTTGKDLGLFIKHPTLLALESPIFKFLQEVRNQTIEIKTPTIAVFEHDTLVHAIGLVSATRVHRVFVVDNEKDYRPVAVISITDILKYLMKE